MNAYQARELINLQWLLVLMTAIRIVIEYNSLKRK